jgi:hypothetical protein
VASSLVKADINTMSLDLFQIERRKLHTSFLDADLMVMADVIVEAVDHENKSERL